MRRILLIETLNQDKHRHHRAEFFPFILGLADEHRLEAHWWVIGVPRSHMHAGARWVVDLPEDRLAVLVREITAFQPDAIVFHDRPSEALLQAIRGVAPECSVEDLTRMGRLGAIHQGTSAAQLLVFLSGEGDDRAVWAQQGEPLVDTVRPRFNRRFLIESDQEAFRQPVRLVVEEWCPYRRPLRDNRFYRELGGPIVQDHRGCAFCGKHWRFAPLRTPPLELVLEQLVAHQTAADPRGGPHEYLLDDSHLSVRLHELFEAILERGLEPSTVHTLVRADTLLAQRAKLEPVLIRMAAAGHRLRLLSVGVENFSEVENERLNKGLSSEQIWAYYGLVREWETRFPDTFASGDADYFATILFTPWTTPDDLRVNLEAARRLGHGFLNRALGTRLQLNERLPITQLARCDGLLSESHGDAGNTEAVCSPCPDQDDLPWRFADPRTEAIHRLLVRLDPSPEQLKARADDALASELRELRAELGEPLASDYVALAAAIVEAVLTVGPEASPRRVMEEVAARCPASTQPADESIEEPPPSPAEPERRPERAPWPVKLLAVLEQRRPEVMGGYHLDGFEVREEDGARWFVLRLCNDQQLLRLSFGARRPGLDFWLAGDRFVAQHIDPLPPSPTTEERLARTLLAAFDRYGSGASASDRG